jgi:hypothetical protein
MTQERLQKLIDLAHSDRKNPMSDALIEMIDMYIQLNQAIRQIEKITAGFMVLK